MIWTKGRYKKLANIKFRASTLSREIESFQAYHENPSPAAMAIVSAMLPTIGFSVGSAHGSRLAGIQNKVYSRIVEADLLDRPESNGNIL